MACAASSREKSAVSHAHLKMSGLMAGVITLRLLPQAHFYSACCAWCSFVRHVGADTVEAKWMLVHHWDLAALAHLGRL